MSIQVNSNFQVNTPQPLDSRNVLTKAEMLNINDNIWPDVYYTICKDDGLMYVYNKTNESNEETGKFRKLESTFNDVNYNDVLNIPISRSIETEISDNIFDTNAISSEDKNVELADDTIVHTVMHIPSTLCNVDNLLEGQRIRLDFGNSEIYDITLQSDDTFVDSDICLKGVYNEDISTATNPEDKKENAITVIIGDDGLGNMITIYIGSKITELDQENIPSIYLLKDVTKVSVNSDYENFFNTLAITTSSFTPNKKIGSITVGNEIPKGTDITELLKLMLIESIPPTISISTSKTLFSNEEEITGTVTVSVDENGSTSNGIKSVTVDGTDITSTMTFEITEAKTYKVVVTYEDNITGKSDTVNSTIEIVSVDPIYWATSDSSNVDSTIKDISTTIISKDDHIDFNVSVDNEYIVIVTKSDLVSILDTNGFENIDSFNKTISNGYNVYISMSPVTCSNFQYTLIK